MLWSGVIYFLGGGLCVKASLEYWLWRSCDHANVPYGGLGFPFPRARDGAGGVDAGLAAGMPRLPE
eukprot:7595032-Prorocentrum_lima.AAC.1